MGIVLKNISYQYKDQWQEEKQYAIREVSFLLEKGEYAALIGHSGSGKSTLLQHLNGLLRPMTGEYYFDGENVFDGKFALQKLRQKVALCFQYPEYQLFEETVLKDITFGPKNLGFDQKTCEEKARKAMELVGISPKLENASPFALSGGQKRRVALAGILAMEPEYLILDEPVAGLDGKGKENLFSLLRYLNEEKKITILLVSHDMDDVAANARRVLVMNHGQLVMDDTTENVFAREKELKAMGLDIPQALQFYNNLRSRGYFKSISETTQEDDAATVDAVQITEKHFGKMVSGGEKQAGAVVNEKRPVETVQAERSEKHTGAILNEKKTVEAVQIERSGKVPLTVEALAARILEENQCFGK